MSKKTTENLMNALKNTAKASDYIASNQEEMIDKPLHRYLEDMLIKKGLSKATVFRNAQINEISGYHIFSGFRLPSRNRLICLCIGMNCDLEETNTLLKYAGFSPLYPRIVRDSYIIWGIEKKLSLLEIDNLLYQNNEKTLQND